MKKFAIVAILLLVAALPAFALGPSIGFGVQADYASLNFVPPLSDVYGAGYGGGAHLDIGFAMLTARISGDYMRFSPDVEKFKAATGVPANVIANVSVDGGVISIISANANLKWEILPLPVVSPYLTGGIGLASISMSDVTVKVPGQPDVPVTTPSAETKTTANLGAGVNFNLGISLFIEAKYTWIFTDNTSSTYVPVTLGVTF